MACTLTITAQTYTWCTNCSGGTNTTSVYLDTLSQVTTEGYKTGAMGIKIPNGNKQTVRTMRLRVTSPITCDLTAEVRISYSFTDSKGNQSGNDTTYQSMTIKKGQTTSASFPFICYDKTVKYKNYAGINVVSRTIVETRDFGLSPQRTLPLCGQPNGCAVKITSVAVTGATFLGSSDGALKVNFAGSTGGTKTYSINGGAFQSSQWFTGLPAGSYSVRIKELSCRDQVYATVPAGQYQTSPFTVIEPSGIVASENPIALSLSTKQYQPDVTFSTTSFTFPRIPLNNFKVKFLLPDYTQEFKAQDFPIRDTYFLTGTLRDRTGVKVGTNSLNTVAVSFAECFENDQYFSTNYFINQSGSTVTLKAKDSSGRFDLTNNNIEVYNPAGVVNTTGLTIQVQSYGKDKYEGSVLNNYSLVVETYQSDAFQYGDVVDINRCVRITEQSLPFSKDNEHTFDTSSIVKNFVSTPKPDLNFTGFTTIPSYMKPFIFKYGERFPLVFGETTTRKREKGYSKPIWICNASLDKEAANDMSIYTGQTSVGGITDVEFLTNSPSVKRTYRNQKELLYFIMPKNIGSSVRLDGYIYFWDGSFTATTLTTITTGSTNFGGVSVINTSYDSIGLDVIEQTTGKQIKQVDVAVYTNNGANQYTKIKSYFYPYHDTGNDFGVCFLNKLGTFETFNFKGVSESAIDRQDKGFTSTPDVQSDGSYVEGYSKETTYDVSVQKKFTVNSGFLDQEHFDWLIELMSSNQIYCYTDEYVNYLTVEGHKYVTTSSEKQPQLEVVFKRTVIEPNVSI